MYIYIYSACLYKNKLELQCLLFKKINLNPCFYAMDISHARLPVTRKEGFEKASDLA